MLDLFDKVGAGFRMDRRKALSILSLGGSAATLSRAPFGFVPGSSTEKNRDDRLVDPQKETFDAVFVGGGPAGLSVASELSKTHKVLVIEKKLAGETDRFWFVPPFVIDETVKPFTYGGVSRYLASTFGGANVSWDVKLFGAPPAGNYPFIDEKRLLPFWKERVERNGSAVMDRTEYIDHSTSDGAIEVKTDKGIFRSRLLVDASGHGSPIVKKLRGNEKNYYWWSIFGAIAEHPGGISPELRVGDYMLWQTFRDTNADPEASLQNGRPVFEYEVLDGSTSFPLVLYLRRNIVDEATMKKEFFHILRNEADTRPFHDVRIRELKFGWYPSGGLEQRAASDRVAFIGDAGCWTTPCGWGMAFILNNYRIYAKHLARSLDEGRLDAGSLAGIADMRVHGKYEILFDKLMTHFLSNAPAPMLDKFILFFRKIDPVLCEKMFTLTLTRSECVAALKLFLQSFDHLDLMRIIPHDDYMTIMEEAGYFMGDAIMDKLAVGKNEKAATGYGFSFG